MPVVLSPSNNPAINYGAYLGQFYAFTASGGYVLEEGFDTIKFRPESSITQYDMTGAIQVLYDVRTFNEKLGLFKDATNIGVLHSTFDPVNDVFAVDSLSISAAEFVAGLNTSRVISVGKYESMYRDFKTYVNTYFGYAGGFSSLFSGASEFDINGGVFDASALMQLITTNATSDGSGAYINAINGSITLSDINRTLKYVVDTNAFGNRTPGGANGTAYDPLTNTNMTNYGMIDGFLAGDLVFVPAGTKVTLNLNIAPESFLPINNIGPANTSTLTQSTNYSTGNFSQNTQATTLNINRVLTAPLLIKLANLSGVDQNSYVNPSNGAPGGVLLDPTSGSIRIGISTDANGNKQLRVTLADLVQTTNQNGGVILTSTGLYYNGRSYTFETLAILAAKLRPATIYTQTTSYSVGAEKIVVIQPGTTTIVLPTGIAEGTRVQLANYSGETVGVQSVNQELIYNVFYPVLGTPLQMLVRKNAIVNMCYIITGGVGSWISEV